MLCKDGWAESSVNSFYQQQITQQVKAQFPNLPEQQLQTRVKEQYADLREQQGDLIEQQIAQTSEQFKQQLKNEQGETYLLAIDPWFYLQEAENIVDNGHTGTTFKDGESWDGHRFAPIGSPAQHNWHSNMMIIVWKVLNFFDRNITLMGGAFWVPLIIASLATVPAFFIARRRAGNLGGFIAASIVAVHTAFLSRTPAGFSDTDAYNVFFPLLITWLFLEAFQAKEQWKKLTYAASAGLALGIYSKIWVGYWYILDILLAVIIGYIVFMTVRHLYQNYQLQQKNKKTIAWVQSEAWATIKHTLLLGVVFYAATGVVVSLLHSFSTFLNAPLGFLRFAALKNAVNPSLWPNVLTTVAELNEVNFAGVVGSMGGKFLYWLALMGVALSIIPKKLKGRHMLYVGIATFMTIILINNTVLNFSAITYLVILMIPLTIGLLMILGDKSEVDIKYALLLLIWFVAAMYTTTKGVRFTLVLVPALAIAIGTFVGLAHMHLSRILSKELEISKKIVVPVLAAVACLILLGPITSAHAVALNEIPSMNDGWYQSLEKIRDESQPDAIITSWWDFGHWFKAIAERPVTFDGGSQNTPMAHWVGKLLLTTDEDESIGILRMLNCGSYTGFDTLNKYINETITSKKLMDDIVLLDNDAAAARLAEAGLTEEQVDEILALTHCTPPEAFLITSQDMVGKAGVWGHFGSWDFEAAYIYNNLKDLTQEEAVEEMMTRFGYDETRATQLYTAVRGLTSERAVNSWISPWPSYTSGWIACNEQIAAVNTSALGLDSDEELENRTIAACSTNLRISSSTQGDVVIENILIDVENPEVTRFRYGIYSGGVRLQTTDEGKPKVLHFAHEDAEDGLEQFSFEEPTSGLGLLYDETNKRVMLMDPLHAGSVFTQLFFLDGKYNDQFEKFSDRTTFNGQRIIVWKVVQE